MGLYRSYVERSWCSDRPSWSCNCCDGRQRQRRKDLRFWSFPLERAVSVVLEWDNLDRRQLKHTPDWIGSSAACIRSNAVGSFEQQYCRIGSNAPRFGSSDHQLNQVRQCAIRRRKLVSVSDRVDGEWWRWSRISTFLLGLEFQSRLWSYVVILRVSLGAGADEILGHLSVGIIILISIAIALGAVLLLVLIGIIATIMRRKDEPNYPAAPRQSMVENVSPRGPTSLLATVGAATVCRIA